MRNFIFVTMLSTVASGAFAITPNSNDDREDARTLNVLLSLEHEQIALATALSALPIWGADTSPLAPVLLQVVKENLKHETAFREVLVAQIHVLNAEPVASRPTSEYLVHYPDAATLSGVDGLVAAERILAEREGNAANALYSVVATFKKQNLYQTLAGIGEAHAGHYGSLNSFTLALATLHAGTDPHMDATTIIPGALPPFSFTTPSPRQ